MQFNLSALIVATLAVVALGNPIPASQCSTGPVDCCNSVGTISNPAISTLVHSLGAVVTDPSVLIGVTCSPITVIGAGGDSCSAQAVCCENNNFNGVIAIGCTPVDLTL